MLRTTESGSSLRVLVRYTLNFLSICRIRPKSLLTNEIPRYKSDIAQNVKMENGAMKYFEINKYVLNNPKKHGLHL